MFENDHRIRLIGLDMDGTLLNTKREISQANIHAIKKAQAQGIQVVVVTGRAYFEALQPLQAAGIKCPMLCVNGAEIRSANGEIDASFPLSSDLYHSAASVLHTANVYFELYTNLGIFTKNKEQAIIAIRNYLKQLTPDRNEACLIADAENRFATREIQYVEDYDEVLAAEVVKIYKLMVFSQNINKLKQVHNLLSQNEMLAVSSSAVNNIEITMYKAQKGNAIQQFASRCDISMDAVMAIGDNYNDISMLTAVGFPVAMGNADQEIKDICKFVTMSNDEDGVAFAIEKFI